MHKFNNNKLPYEFMNFFSQVSSKYHYNTRLSAKSSLSLSQPRTNYGKFNIRFIGPKTWNDIDESIKSLSESSFKKDLKQQLIDYY